MAETRLPDEVPAKDLATSVKDAGELPAVVLVSGTGGVDPSSAGWHLSVRGNDSASVEPPIVVQIWSNSGTPESPTPTCPSTPAEPQSLDEELTLLEQHRRRSASQYSDSGIESQLASPTVTDAKLHHEQSLVLELSATHLTVPGRFRPPPLTGTNSSSANQAKDVETVQTPIAIEESDHSESERSESLSTSNFTSSKPLGFLPQKRHHRNFLPVDHSLDGWRKRSDDFTKIRSLPTECERDASTEAADDNVAASLSDSGGTPLANRPKPQLSPKICIENEASARRKRESGRSLDEQSTVSESRSVGSYSIDSEGSAAFLADQDTELGSYFSSRHASICSARSESISFDQSLSARQPARCPSKSQQDEMPPSRSPSARFNFLSVPQRNNVWPTPEQQQRHHSANLSALHSQLGSLSSLMNSRLSLSNSYLRLAMAGGGMDDIMLVNTSIDEVDRYGDASADEAHWHYERERAAIRAAQLSLTQRLAFPELVEADAESGHVRSKAYSRQNELPREESSLNFFAKIITFLVLVFVIVLVVGVLVKISHTPK